MFSKIKPSSALSQFQQKEQSLFNESFYRQKLDSEKGDNQQNYLSYDYINKYFTNRKIDQIISKAIKKTLQGSSLPQNPYNVISRLILHQSIFENLKIYYNFNPNQGILQQQGNKRNAIKLQQKKDNEIFIKQLYENKSYYLNSILGKHANLETVHYVLLQIFKGSYEQKIEILQKKYQLQSVMFAVGGSLIIRTGCPYSTQNLIHLSCFLVSHQQETKAINVFGMFVLDDCLELQKTPNTLLVKLECFNEEIEQIVEWSPEQIVKDRLKILKQIKSHCFERQKKVIATYSIKANKENIQKLGGNQYLLINKIYNLISLDSNRSQYKIFSIEPYSSLMKEVFLDPNYFKLVNQALKLPPNLDSIIDRYFPEEFKKIIYAYRTQQIRELGWNILYFNIFEKQPKTDLLKMITFLIDSPISYFEQLIYKLKIAKLLAQRSSATQLQIYSIIQYTDKILLQQIQKSQYIYPDTIILLSVLRKITSTILDNSNIKASAMLSLLLTLISILKAIVTNYSQIILVIQKSINDYITEKVNKYGTSQSHEIIARTITYDIYCYKYKKSPSKSLQIQKEIQKYSKQLFLSPSQIHDTLISKYINKYKLYDHIYNFYWSLICGKKIRYPMSQFLHRLKFLSIRIQHEADNQQRELQQRNNRFKPKINCFTIQGTDIYEIQADIHGENVMYAFNADALQFNSLKDYIGYYELLTPLICPQGNDNKQIKHIFSIKSNDNIGKSQQSSANSIKFYVDLFIQKNISQSQVYKLIYQKIVTIMDRFDKNQFNVLGIFAGSQEIYDDQNILNWSPTDSIGLQLWIKYDYKSRPSFQKIVKFFRNCQRDNRQLQLKLIYHRRNILKSCTISFNVYYSKAQTISKFNQLINHQQRVFFKRNDILDWKQYNQQRDSKNSKKSIKILSFSQKLITMGDVNIMSLLIETNESNDIQISLKQVKSYSNIYNQLQQSIAECENLIQLVRYLKYDRRGRQQLQSYKNTIDILQYHIFDKCLLLDRYFHSQGLSVSIFNLFKQIQAYFLNHTDNNGDQWELIYFQRNILKLMNYLKYHLISCGIQTAQTIRNIKIQKLQKENLLGSRII